MNKVVFVLIFLAVSVYSQCSRARLDSEYTTLASAINRFDNIFDEGAPFAWVGPSLSFGANAILPCNFLVGALVASTANESLTIASRDCPFAANDPRRQSDPCCNMRTRFTQCCTTRPIQVSRPLIRTFNNLINDRCNTPNKVRALIRHFQRNYENRDAFCDTLQTRRIQQVYVMQRKMQECMNDYFYNTRPCTQNSDCASQVCNPETERCVAGFLDSPPGPLAQCLFNSIPRFAVRAFAVYNNFTSPQVAVTEITTLIFNAIFKDTCINAAFQTQSLLTTKATCEAPKVCTDGTAGSCPNNGSFCGAFCSNTNGQCAFNVGFINNAQLCNSIGQCINKNPITGEDLNDNFYTNATDCASQSICTSQACYPNCNAQKCATLGTCVGFPSAPGKPACIVPFVIPEDGNLPTCEFNTDVNVGVGCFRPSVTLESECSSRNGRWYLYPTSKAECESYSVCREPENLDMISLKNTTECSRCNGIVFSPFTWVPARWRGRIFQQRTTWTQRRLVNANRFIKVIDLAGFAGFVLSAIRAVAYPIYKSSLMCRLQPVYRAYGLLTCACGSDRVVGQDCFANFNGPNNTLILPGVGVGVVRAFAGAAQNFSFGDATIRVNDNSVSLNNDNTNIEITKTDVIVSSQLDLTTRSSMQSSRATASVLSNGAVIGQVVGDGITISQAFAMDVTLCIKRNPDMQVQNAAFNIPAFAVGVNGQYVRSAVTVVSSTNVEICANVREANTYYPAMVSNTPVAPEASRRANSGVTVRCGIIVLLFALIAFLF